MAHSRLWASRVSCPCCGYPTLSALAAYEICELCNWEDDGQYGENAEEVRDGPNADYSLAEARRNFNRYRVMYAPGRDQRLTGQDSPLEYESKGQLMAAFSRLLVAHESERLMIEAEIKRLERVLEEEMVRQVRAYERKQSGA